MMKMYVISTGTITYAMRGRDILRKKGYKAYLKRITNEADRVGCGYSIVVVGVLDNISELLHNAGIKILSISEERVG